MSEHPILAVAILVLFLVVCVMLVIVVLLQKGRGGGLGAAFGGAGSSAFGTRTGDVFTWITIVLTGLFLLLAIGGAVLVRPGKTQALEPRFSPAPKAISEPTKVTIACGTKNAEIHYTLDNSVPTENSPKYESPVAVMPGTRLKAIAVRADKDNSPVAEAYYGFPTASSLPGELPKPTSRPSAESIPVPTPPASAPAKTPTAATPK